MPGRGWCSCSRWRLPTDKTETMEPRMARMTRMRRQKSEVVFLRRLAEQQRPDPLTQRPLRILGRRRIGITCGSPIWCSRFDLSSNRPFRAKRHRAWWRSLCRLSLRERHALSRSERRLCSSLEHRCRDLTRPWPSCAGRVTLSVPPGKMQSRTKHGRARLANVLGLEFTASAA